MGKVKVFRQNLINLIHSVGSKSLFSVLCYDNQHKFGLDPSESKIVAYKAFSYILDTSQTRTSEQIIFPLPEGRNSHQKKSYSSSSKKDIILTVYSHDDLLLLREFGLKEMQNSRIARLMEEAYFQNVIFTLDTLSLLTNISFDSLRDRLKQWNSADINLCVSGQSIKSRGSLFRASYLVKSFLKDEDLLSIRKFLCYSEDTANHLLINFVRLYSGLRDGLSSTRISATATVSQLIIEQWCSLIGEFENLYHQNLSMLEDYFKIQAASIVKSNADSIHHQLLYELKELHNFSPAKIECYMHYLLDHCKLLDSIERHPQDIVYYAVSQFEPPSNPLSQCQLLTCKIRFIDIENDFKLLSRGRVYDLKWGKILRYSTQSRSFGAVLSSYDLAFLIGVDDSVITRQLKDHPNVFVPTRGNVIDTGPALSHVEKIVSLFMEGYTETEIMTRTGHSRESVENYIQTFCTIAGLIERGIPLTLIRQITKRSKRLIELHKSLYDRFNISDYQFVMMRVRSIFANHEQLKSKKKLTLKEVAPIKTKSSNPKDIYNRLLDKSVLRAQCHQLSQRFDFTKISWIAERACAVFYSSMSEYEVASGIRRLEPGEMLADFNGRQVILPVTPVSLMQSLKSGKSFGQAIWEHEFKLVDIANIVDTSATIRDIHILLNPRALLPLTRQTPCTNPPVFNGTSVNEMYIKRKAASHTLVPSRIRKTMEDTLVCEGISKERAHAIADLLARFHERFYPKVEDLKPGQLSWNAISATDNFQETHSNKYREQVPVILTIHTPDEIHAIKSNICNLTLGFINDVLQQQISRVTREAYLQGGLLSQLDLQMFFYRSHGTISKQIVEYEQKHKTILPTPGTIKDAGRRFTHKHIVISLYLEGFMSKEIAVKTRHSGIAVDRYIDGFLRVMALHLYSIPPEVMSRTLKLGIDLVNEYISIVKDHFPNRDTMISHLREHGVEIG